MPIGSWVYNPLGSPDVKVFACSDAAANALFIHGSDF